MFYYNEQELIKIREKIDLKLQTASLKEYLRADPQQAGEKTALSREMTLPFFFKYFYCHNESADEFINIINYHINAEYKRNIVLYGYEGCGKTTFIHYWMRKKNIGI